MLLADGPTCPTPPAPCVEARRSLDTIFTAYIVEVMANEPADVQTLLPLPPVTFHILVALSDDDRHGYAIIQDIAARTNGEIEIQAGTLYRSIQRMLEQGLVAEKRTRPA